MMRSAESRWYSAYQAYNRAQNPTFKEYWLKVMNHFRKEFN
jgi:hypothetical protein